MEEAWHAQVDGVRMTEHGADVRRRNCQTSLFELVIRAVGGLLSAYDLSGDEVFLTK